jgi:predicted lipoprotein with Yx(FWY)xxD motif
VNSKGLTAYYFDVDKANSGMSACTGACATTWPAITTSSATPTVKGVTGTLGEITDPAGAKQITIDGRPIYTFASDSKPGDVNGQGVQGVWHVVSPSGSEIK